MYQISGILLELIIYVFVGGQGTGDRALTVFLGHVCRTHIFQSIWSLWYFLLGLQKVHLFIRFSSAVPISRLFSSSERKSLATRREEECHFICPSVTHAPCVGHSTWGTLSTGGVSIWDTTIWSLPLRELIAQLGNSLMFGGSGLEEKGLLWACKCFGSVEPF